MSQNRSKSRESKQSSISSISSHIPLMSTSKNDDNQFLTQSLASTIATPDLHSFLQSYPVTPRRDSKRSRTICQPKGTIPYTVGDTDTLEKVALHFNLTPSELLHLNKLNTRMVFPGQILFVPDECESNNCGQQQSTTIISPPPAPALSPTPLTKNKDGNGFILTDGRLSCENSSLPASPLHHQSQQDVGPMVWSMARQSAARPGRAQRLNNDPNTECEPLTRPTEDHLETQQDHNSKQLNVLQESLIVDENHQLDKECLQRFIKVNVRLMTEDRQGVAGTLLVTPNAVMFDPDVLDPLVKEHGIDKYGLIIRMVLLAGIAVYEDLAMYEHEATSRDEEKRKLYRSTSVKHAQDCLTNTILNTDETEIHNLMSSLLDRIDKELNPSLSSDTCCMLFNASTIQRHISQNYDDDGFLPTATDDIFSDDLFQPLDDYKHSIGILLDDNDDDKNVNKNFNRVPSQISYVFDWTRFKRAIRIKKGCHLENCVPIDQLNKRFGEIDKLLYKQQQNYCAPPSIEIPYYLRIKTSTNTHDVPSLSPRQYKNSVDNIYGKKRLEHEYWFSVPKEKIDHLYSFFLDWTPEHELHPLIDDDQLPDINHIKHNEKSTNKGFVLLDNDQLELNDNQQKKSHYLKRQSTLLKDWEYNNKITTLNMIRTCSTASSNTSCSSNEHPSPSPSSNTHRFTLHSLVARLSDSKNNLLEQIPHQQQRLTRFRKRAKSFLSSTLTDHLADEHLSSSDRRNSSAGIISVDEIYRRINSAHSDDGPDGDFGIPPPRLLQRSTLVNEVQSKQILLELPARVQSLDWYMTFSTETHGFSLNQLYRRSFEFDHDSPSLLIVKDVEQNVFGAFVTHQLLISEGFYGTGESFLFTFFPEFRVFNWSGYNAFYVKGDVNSLGFGIGEGTYGLWLDADLYHGRTCPSKTFNNERLSSNEDFIIASVEVWTFTN